MAPVSILCCSSLRSGCGLRPSPASVDCYTDCPEAFLIPLLYFIHCASDTAQHVLSWHNCPTCAHLAACSVQCITTPSQIRGYTVSAHTSGPGPAVLAMRHPTGSRAVPTVTVVSKRSGHYCVQSSAFLSYRVSGDFIKVHSK